MSVHDDRIEKDIYRSVTLAYDSIFRSGQGLGYWNLVDQTAFVMLALLLREPRNSPWVQAPREWLLSKQEKSDEITSSWDDNVSDTAIALIALLRAGTSPTDHRITKALEYLHKIYQANGRSNWEDEPWETSWSILAVYEYGHQDLMEAVCNSVRWLMALQSEDGRIIAPHYTAYFVKIVDTLTRKQDALGLCAIDSPDLQRSAKMATQYLLQNVTEERLWTGEAWSNGQILWALASSDEIPHDDMPFVNRVVDWFLREQGADGRWCDDDDTACAIIGLVALLKGHIAHHHLGGTAKEDVDTIVCNHLRRLHEAPKLTLGKRFVMRLEDGTTTLNFTPKMLKVATVLFAFVSGLTVFIAVWEFLKEYLGW